MTLPPLPLRALPPLPLLPPPKPRKAAVLAAEDIGGYHEFRGWLRAQHAMSAEGTLMQYPVGNARIAAVEARRILLSLPPRLP